MVLRASYLLALLAALGCLHRKPPEPPAKSSRLAVYVLNTSSQSPERVATPRALDSRLRERLAPLGLVVEPTDADIPADQTNTKVLVESIARRARDRNDHPARALLLETDSQFYNELEGRFRWTVAVKATLFYTNRPGDALSTTFDAPAILNFPHQGARDALVFAADPIAREVAAVARRFNAEQPEPEPEPEPGEARPPGQTVRPRAPARPEPEASSEPPPPEPRESDPEPDPAGNPLSNPQAAALP